MKLIQKAVPDPVFRSWVANLATLPTCSDDWDRLRLPEKGILRTSLLKEQGYICCYCQSRVDDERCHIEHLIPRKVEPEKMFEYDNVLASCNGGDDEDAPVRLRPLSPHIPEHKHYLYRHCGHKRQRDELLVTPLDTNCSAFFTYSSDGRIDPVEGEHSESARITIEDLGLDDSNLAKRRKNAVRAILEDSSITEVELRRCMDAFSEATDGKFQPFCQVIVHVLAKYVRV